MGDSAVALPPGFVQDGPPAGFVLDSPAEKPSAVSRFLDPLNPMHLVHALFKPSDNPKEDPRATFGKNVVGMVKDLGMAQVNEGKAALKSWEEGDHTSAIAHGMAALTPILGPMGQQAAEKFNSGDIAGGLGTFAAMAVPELIHEAPGMARGVKAGAKAVGDFATSPTVVKALKRSSEGAVIGSAMHGNIPGVLTSGAARIVAEKLGEIGERRRAPVPPGTATPEMLKRAGVPLTAAEQALADDILAGVEREEPPAPTTVPRETVTPQGSAAPPAADFESIPLQGPADMPAPRAGQVGPAAIPAIQSPGIVLPKQGAVIPPEVPALDAQRELAQSLNPEGAIPPEPSPHPPAEAFEGAYRAKRAQILADHFHQNGLSYDDLKHLTPEDLTSEQWEGLLGKDPDTGVQYHKPSQKTIDQARVFLAGKSAAGANPKALAAAQELAGVGPQGSNVVPISESAAKAVPLEHEELANVGEAARAALKAGRVDDWGMRTLELAGRRLGLSARELDALIEDSSRGGIASGVDVAAAVKRLVPDEAAGLERHRIASARLDRMGEQIAKENAEYGKTPKPAGPSISESKPKARAKKTTIGAEMKKTGKE